MLLGTGLQAGFWRCLHLTKQAKEVHSLNIFYVKALGVSLKCLLYLPVCSSLRQKDRALTQSRTSGSGEQE